ncbi:MAG: hypothetical protein H6Q25_972 [Bacteroidetes bacterium]|nr:hypothetical protein [Bacteroidota bacterium]
MSLNLPKNLFIDSFFRFISIFLLGIFLLLSCKQSSKYSGLSENSGDWKEMYGFYSNDSYYDFFKNHIKTTPEPDSIDQLMIEFYLNHDPFWSNEGFQAERIAHLLSIIKNSTLHGLPCEMFEYPFLKSALDSVSQFKIKDQQILYDVLSHIEWKLTRQYLHYVKSIHFGALNPAEIHPGKWLYPPVDASIDFYKHVLNNMDRFEIIIDSLTPKTNSYLRLQKELEKYATISDTTVLDTFKHTKTYFTDKIIANLERLRWKTDKPATNYIAINIPDFTLRTFMSDTCAVVLKICCGQTHTKSQREKLTFVNGVCPSGKWETPLLKSRIYNLVLNPEWNIPYSILKEEYFPKLKKDKQAIISKEKLMVYNSRRERVEPGSIDWNQYTPKNIPFVLVQSSGKHNALGVIKFDFPNPESVYVHDTPNKGAFNRKNRAISHGCCRVENPLQLAQIVWQYNELTEEEIEKLMIVIGVTPVTEMGILYSDTLKLKEELFYQKLTENEKKWYRPLRPSRYNLKKSIPLYIEYFTCFLNEKDSVQYCNDVYYKDQGILYQLNNLKK